MRGRGGNKSHRTTNVIHLPVATPNPLHFLHVNFFHDLFGYLSIHSSCRGKPDLLMYFFTYEIGT